MAFNYTATRTTAKRLLTRFGATVSITGTSAETFDPITGAYTGGGSASITGVGVKSPFKKHEIDGETVLKTDVKLIFEGAAGVPAIGNTATLNGIGYRIQNVMPLEPAETSVIYIMQLRA